MATCKCGSEAVLIREGVTVKRGLEVWPADIYQCLACETEQAVITSLDPLRTFRDEQELSDWMLKAAVADLQTNGKADQPTADLQTNGKADQPTADLHTNDKREV